MLVNVVREHAVARVTAQVSASACAKSSSIVGMSSIVREVAGAARCDKRCHKPCHKSQLCGAPCEPWLALWNPARPRRFIVMLRSAAVLVLFFCEACAFSPTRGAMRLRAAPTVRSAVPRAMAQPYRQDDTYNYYRVTADKELSVTKPLGAILVDGVSGVTVESIQDGTEGLLKKGDQIKAVNGVDVTQREFDDVMAMLIDAPEQLQLSIGRPSIMRKRRDEDSAAVAPTVVATQEPSKLDKAFDRNFGSVEATAKTLKKTAIITTNAATWKNPIYFWSVAGTALIFVPIIWYSVSSGK